MSENPDTTIGKLCELFELKTGNRVSRTAMFRGLQKSGLSCKKNRVAVNM